MAAALGSYVARNGGDSLAALRDNTEGQRRDYVQVEGSELMGLSADEERVNQAEIDAVVAAGDVERARVLLAQERVYAAALRANEGQDPHHLARDGFDRAKSNADALAVLAGGH